MSSNADNAYSKIEQIASEYGDSLPSPEETVLLSQELSSQTEHLLRSLLEKKKIDSSNAVFVLSGKSAEVVRTFLLRVAQSTENAELAELIANAVTLDSKNNSRMYAGNVPEELMAQTAGKTLVFIDDFAEDYYKASAYLTGCDAHGLSSMFVALAGSTKKLDPGFMNLSNRIFKSTIDQRSFEFVRALSKLQSQKVGIESHQGEYQNIDESQLTEKTRAAYLLLSESLNRISERE